MDWILAMSFPDAEWLPTLVMVMISLAAAAGGVLAALKIVVYWRALAGDAEPKSNPPLHQIYATKPELNRLREDVDEKIGEVKRDVKEGFSGLQNSLKAYDSKSEERTEKVHQRVNVILGEVSNLKGRLSK